MTRERHADLLRAFEERELTRDEQLELLHALEREMIVSRGYELTIDLLRISLKQTVRLSQRLGDFEEAVIAMKTAKDPDGPFYRGAVRRLFDLIAGLPTEAKQTKEG